jgi:shikimate kinase
VRIRRVVLLGFMGAGKSAVGRKLAYRLGWRFVDLDQEIERAAGRSIAEIFRTEGEPAFREMEARLTPRWMAASHVVLAPGGGWITNPGLLQSVPPDTLTVWLKVSPDEILRRVRAGRGQTTRPLLQAADPEARVRELLASREPLYRQAQVTIETDGLTVSAVASRLERILQGTDAPPMMPERDMENGS